MKCDLVNMSYVMKPQDKRVVIKAVVVYKTSTSLSFYSGYFSFFLLHNNISVDCMLGLTLFEDAKIYLNQSLKAFRCSVRSFPMETAPRWSTHFTLTNESQFDATQH